MPEFEWDSLKAATNVHEQYIYLDQILRPEYEFDYGNAQRGLFYEQAMRAKRFVEIDADVLQAFPDAGELNGTLRSLIEPSGRVTQAG